MEKSDLHGTSTYSKREDFMVKLRKEKKKDVINGKRRRIINKLES